MAIIIELNGREIPLEYTTMEMLTIQEEIGQMNEAIAKCCGRNPEDAEDESKYGAPEHLKTLGKMVKILGNAGLELDGQEADLTVKKVLRGIRPDRIFEYSNACMDCLTQGMRSEIPHEEQEPKEDSRGRVDIGLEEMRKKDGAEG